MCSYQAGFTLVEMGLATVIIAILASTAITTLGPVQTIALDTAVHEVVQALQFARQHAISTNSQVIVKFDTANKTVQVVRPDFSVVPAGEIPVMHPAEKRPYIASLGTLALIGSAVNVSALFTFNDGSTMSSIAFDRVGAPGKVISATFMEPLVEPGLWRGTWQAGGVSYKSNDWVVHNNVNYNALQGHNSGTSFEADAFRWAVRTQPAQITVSAGAYKHNIHVIPATGFVHTTPQ